MPVTDPIFLHLFQVRLYRLVQQLLNSALYRLCLRCTDECLFLFDTEVTSGACARMGEHFPRPPWLSHSWCHIDLDLHLHIVPGRGPLFSLRPCVDDVIRLLQSTHDAVMSICVSSRPLSAAPLLGPFVHMATSVDRSISLPPSEPYSFPLYLADCVRNTVQLGEASTTSRSDGQGVCNSELSIRVDASAYLPQANAAWAHRLLTRGDPLLEELRIRTLESVCRAFQKVGRRVERFVAVIEFTQEAQGWHPDDVAARIRQGLPWSQVVLDRSLHGASQEELADRLEIVNAELSRLQSLAKRYTRLEASVDGDDDRIAVGPCVLLIASIRCVLKSTPDSVLHKLRRDLPAIFNTLCGQTLSHAYTLCHRMSRPTTSLEQFCDVLQTIDDAEQHASLFVDEVAMLKHYYAFLQVRTMTHSADLLSDIWLLVVTTCVRLRLAVVSVPAQHPGQ